MVLMGNYVNVSYRFLSTPCHPLRTSSRCSNAACCTVTAIVAYLFKEESRLLESSSLAQPESELDKTIHKCMISRRRWKQPKLRWQALCEFRSIKWHGFMVECGKWKLIKNLSLLSKLCVLTAGTFFLTEYSNGKVIYW